ncbi:MAG TPA: hypothetical protein VGB37_03195 [Candidatus Lokiarchaeia archaeon]
MGIITDILKDIPLSSVLRERIIEQEKIMTAQESKIKFLESQLKTFQSNNLKSCPYCNTDTGILQDRQRHKLFGEAGVFTHIYKCSNCNKNYDRDVNK